MNPTMKKLVVTAAALAVVSMAALIQGGTAVIGAPDGQAQDLFKAKCAACHGADASGNTPMGKKLNIRDLHSAEVQSQTDAQLSDIISKGKGKMPAYEKSLTAEQISQLVAFIRELNKKN